MIGLLTNSPTSALKLVQNIIVSSIKLALDIGLCEDFVMPLPKNANHDYQILAAVKPFNKDKKINNSFGFQTLGEYLKSKLPENEDINSLEVSETGFVLSKLRKPFLRKELQRLSSKLIYIRQRKRKWSR